MDPFEYIWAFECSDGSRDELSISQEVVSYQRLSKSEVAMTKVGACLGRQQFTYGRVQGKVREIMMFAIDRDASFATDRMKMDVPTTVLGILADCRP